MPVVAVSSKFVQCAGLHNYCFQTFVLQSLSASVCLNQVCMQMLHIEPCILLCGSRFPSYCIQFFLRPIERVFFLTFFFFLFFFSLTPIFLVALDFNSRFKLLVIYIFFKMVVFKLVYIKYAVRTQKSPLITITHCASFRTVIDLFTAEI